MKRYFALIPVVLFSLTVCAQVQRNPVLMRINGKEISLSEFQSQYNKNANRMPLNEYLDLFIDNQLKISEARTLGIDTTTAFVSQLKAYRRQMSKSYFLNNAQLQPTGKSKENTYIEGLHIYKYLPQNTPIKQVSKIEQQMDSLHRAIKTNPSIDFTTLVNQYSHDTDTFCVCRLQMPEEFEKVAFNLNKGEVSAPFFTPQGIHIVKVLDRKKNITEAYSRDIQDDAFLNRIKAASGYAPNQNAFDELLAKGETQKTLFTIAGKSYTGNDFAYFSQDNTRSIQLRINDFVRKSLYSYENSRLDLEFSQAIQAYSDVFLLSGINRRISENIRNEKEIEAYFSDHKKHYRWELPRYKGLVIHTQDKKTGKKIKKQLRKIPEKEQMAFLQRTYNGTIIAEQGTFAVAQNGFVDKMVFKVGSYTPIKTHPFTVLVGRKVKGPESYEEVREVVISDYQKDWEERWLSHLRKKSKVEINQEVLKTVNNH
ncbi:peptidylprolyl isomerase [Bacteroides sp. 519]|uniref:peptidylprolyl isomerase n=1 Tax=Bacteroides sp. 519 TaxID=2302937 RepID=UPI0013D38432|nr:peptidylprolyl isomerase [Bacteroides sp. 519]NDV59936.1 peptidylprolyl isomerase [Bacteroides sp. 519]